MAIQKLLHFWSTNQEILKIILASIAGFVTLATFLKTIFEYRLQGRQKRMELVDKLMNRIWADESLRNLMNLLNDDNVELKNTPELVKYELLGLYEQIAISINSGLIKKNVAHYFFGYYVISCWNSKNFWSKGESEEIDKFEYYWIVLKNFASQMQRVEERRTNPNLIQRKFDKLLYRRLYRY